MVLDIGGGSTELVIGEKFEPLLIESRRMGCVSFARTYFPNEEITPEFFSRAYLGACLKLESTAILFKNKHGTSQWALLVPSKPPMV